MKLNLSEMKLMEIIWDKEPVRSGELVRLSEQKLGWKKSTMYTVLKHLTEKSAANNSEGVVTALVKRNEQMNAQSENILERSSNGSLPLFLTAFFNDKKLSPAEAKELKELIDRYTEANDDI